MHRLKLGRLALSAVATLGLAAGASAEGIETNAMDIASWGYKISGLGAVGNEVVLVYTNASEDANMSWSVPPGVGSFDYLVVGGGGGGGGTSSANCGGGGGGAGAVRTGTVVVSGGESCAVVVGKGGDAGTGRLKNGGPAATAGGCGGSSSLTVGTVLYDALGGGGGGQQGHAGLDGGCGGGGGSKTGAAGAVLASSDGNVYGNVGGVAAITYVGTSPTYPGAGGGGAATDNSGKGGKPVKISDSPTSAKAGDGGDGVLSAITGEEIVYGGGGGGGASRSDPACEPGNGGLGGGGIGYWKNSAGKGVDGLGGGGGGAGNATYGTNGARGGSGVVVIRYAAWEPTYVAKIGDQEFDSLQAAIDAATAGDTIGLFKNVSYSNVTVLINKDVTLDGNGCKVTGTSSNPDAKLFQFENAAVNVTNLTVESKGYLHAFFYNASNEVNATFCDVTVESDGSALTASGEGVTVDVADCDFTHAGKYKEDAGEWLLTTIAAWNGSTINVNSGSYKSDAATLYVLPSGGEINVLGGTIEAETHAFAAYYDGVSPTRVVVPTNSTALVKGDFYVVHSSGSDEPFVLMGGTYDREPPEKVASKFKSVADGYLAEKIDGGLWRVRAMIPITGIEIGNAPTAAIGVGTNVELTVTILPENTDYQKTVTWASDNEEVATVNEAGVVTAVAAGEVTITATAVYGDNVTNSVKITVSSGTSGYPSYIGDDPVKQEKYNAWAQQYGADTEGAYEKAFLLNVAPDAAEDAEKKFKITSITVDGDTVSIEVAEGPDGGYNGTVEIQGAATLLDEQWEPKADGKGQKFFKAVLK